MTAEEARTLWINIVRKRFTNGTIDVRFQKSALKRFMSIKFVRGGKMRIEHNVYENIGHGLKNKRIIQDRAYAWAKRHYSALIREFEEAYNEVV